MRRTEKASRSSRCQVSRKLARACRSSIDVKLGTFGTKGKTKILLSVNGDNNMQIIRLFTFNFLVSPDILGLGVALQVHCSIPSTSRLEISCDVVVCVHNACERVSVRSMNVLRLQVL